MTGTAILRAHSPRALEDTLQQFAALPGLQSVAPCGEGLYVATRHAVSPASNSPTNLSLEQSEVCGAVISSKDKKDILVIAGPGSGKTKTLIASLVAAVESGVTPEKIVAITFTNNAAAELQVRLFEQARERSLPGLHRVHVSTFHAWVGVLQAAKISPWCYPPVSLRTAGLAVALHLTNPDSASHVFTKAEISAADRHLEGSETFEEMKERNFNKIGSGGKNSAGFKNLERAVAKLGPQLGENQIATYGTLMRSGTRLAEEFHRDSLQWLFIDEAQDLNHPQAEFVEAVQKRSGCRVFAIADDDQGIYKFRGASNRFLREFGARKTTRNFQLTQNFRSTKAIVDLCRKWIATNWEFLGTPAKTLHSDREGLPVVILSAGSAESRGRHAKIIMDAAKSAGLIRSLGEVACLAFSTAFNPFELEESGMPFTPLSDRKLPEEVLDAWLDKLTSSKATGNWHHSLWMEFLEQVTADQKENGDPMLGHPGLAELYGSLEAIRRLAPALSPKAAADVIQVINSGKDRFPFLGDRPDPNYIDDSVNLISLHSSKGMEFPIVWLTGCGYAQSVRDFDEEQGQPNVLGELGDWAKKIGRWCKLIHSDGTIDRKALNKIACQLENRRLLYVGMSRATDLLILSAPPSYKKGKKDDDAFKAEIEAMLQGIPHQVISSERTAREFAATLSKSHRHPTWTAPHRYRVESFTSLTHQPAPGEIREVEIPREREYPRPQSLRAMIGDLFHRIMHLLCLEPETVKSRLAGRIDNAQLIARVSTRDPATELKPLDALLENYFSDTVNQPWKWLENAKSEVPFCHLTKNAAGETALVKGYIDLVRFDFYGIPNLIMDYKTGFQPTLGSAEANTHIEQLGLYQNALACNSSNIEKYITISNYYPLTQKLIRN